MFDKKSDYALNKRVKDAIIYKSVTGTPVLLIRADFTSEDEFLQWKAWSDGEYQDTERSGRSFYDNGVALDERLNCIGVAESIEDEFFGRLSNAERIQNCADLSEQIRNILTEKQYRRLWLYYVDGMTIEAIAIIEGVAHQNISKAIASAKKKIEKLLQK